MHVSNTEPGISLSLGAWGLRLRMQTIATIANANTKTITTAAKIIDMPVIYIPESVILIHHYCQTKNL